MRLAGKLERVAGIEPASQAWKFDASLLMEALSSLKIGSFRRLLYLETPHDTH
jgi:hypothetical protein